MNEKETKDWLQKSIIETSDDFTDKLMQRITTKEVREKAFIWRFMPVFFMLVAAILVVSFALYNYLESGITLFDVDIEIGRTPIFALATALLLLAMNHILKLNEAYGLSKSKM